MTNWQRNPGPSKGFTSLAIETHERKFSRISITLQKRWSWLCASASVNQQVLGNIRTWNRFMYTLLGGSLEFSLVTLVGWLSNRRNAKESWISLQVNWRGGFSHCWETKGRKLWCGTKVLRKGCTCTWDLKVSAQQSSEKKRGNNIAAGGQSIWQLHYSDFPFQNPSCGCRDNWNYAVLSSKYNASQCCHSVFARHSTRQRFIG